MRLARKMKRPAVVIDGRRHLGYAHEARGPVNARTLRVERGATLNLNGHLVVVEVLDVSGQISGSAGGSDKRP